MATKNKFNLTPIETTYAVQELYSQDEEKFLCNNFLYKKETYKFDKNTMLELAAYIALHYFRVNHLDIKEELYKMVNNETFKLKVMENYNLKSWLTKKNLLNGGSVFLKELNSLKDLNYKTYDYTNAYNLQMELIGNTGNH